MSHGIFTNARESMVVSQLHPSGITDEALLDIYRMTPREAFVAPEKRGICYSDQSLDMGKGRFLAEPLFHATMVNHLNLDKNSTVLDIGGLTGYSAAILSQLAGTVVAIDQDAHAVAFARDVLQALEFFNVTFMTGPHAAGHSQDEGYNAILINGAVSERPENLFNQLKSGGRLACVLRPDNKPLGKVIVYTKSETGVVSPLILQDTAAAYVPGFEPKPVFAL